MKKLGRLIITTCFILGIIFIFKGLIISSRVKDVKDTYTKNVFVVTDYKHYKDGYAVNYKYMIGTTVYDKYLEETEQPTIGDTKVVYMNPKNKDEVIFESELKDDGLRFFKAGVALLVLGVIFIYVMIHRSNLGIDEEKEDVNIEDIIGEETEVTNDNS